jgi:hypothetical protein
MVIALLVSLASFAGEGHVVVLEAPMFRKPDVSSEVIQYVHKNERIYVHPVVMNDRSRHQDIPVDADKVRKELNEDPFYEVSEEKLNYHDGMDFILTKDNQGRNAWMLREHVFVYYEDQREKTQKDPNPDPTDYRLREPLPATFPIVRDESLRGNMVLSLGTPYTRSYPYNEKIKAEARGFQYELNAQFTKRRMEKEVEFSRWYYGGMLTVRTSENRFTLEERRAQEQWVRFGGGGVASFDAWRTEKQRIVLTGSLIAYPFTQASISQTDQDGVQENRTYLGWNFGARAGTQWHFRRVLAELDFVIGVWGEFESPMRLQAKTSTNRPEWWGGGKSDTFSPNATFTFAGVIGFQSTY